MIYDYRHGMYRHNYKTKQHQAILATNEGMSAEGNHPEGGSARFVAFRNVITAWPTRKACKLVPKKTKSV
eukprot:6818144-Alexandrium_andersonii.AAC.1